MKRILFAVLLLVGCGSGEDTAPVPQPAEPEAQITQASIAVFSDSLCEHTEAMYLNYTNVYTNYTFKYYDSMRYVIITTQQGGTGVHINTINLTKDSLEVALLKARLKLYK